MNCGKLFVSIAAAPGTDEEDVCGLLPAGDDAANVGERVQRNLRIGTRSPVTP